MPRISFTLTPSPPSANNLFFNVIPRGNARRSRIPTDRYKKWKTAAGWQLKEQKVPSIIGRVLIEARFAEPHRRTDLDGKAKSLLDLLVTSHIIEEDHDLVVRGIQLYWDPEVADGVCVTITPTK